MLSSRTAANIILGTSLLCAVVVTGLVLARELGWTGSEDSAAVRTPVEPSVWNAIAGGGHRFGADSGALVIVEFADFQCRFCKRYRDEVLQPFLTQHGASVTLVRRHFLLSYHPLARASSLAAECASNQGRLEALHDLMYALQDSLGLVPFAQMAEAAAVPDLDEFERCMHHEATARNVDRDMELARLASVRGTPSIFVNGTRFLPPPSFNELEWLLKGAK